MTKAELVKKWHEAADGHIDSLGGAGQALAALCDVIAAELLAGGEVSLPGLGKLKVRDVLAKTARNPRTGEPVQVPAKRRAVFVAGKDLKDALN